jgi:kynurenine--oxoglutarate transaminase/cysteine-S-conjugate beta-lyase/glutamine--phenylpyruvate transaminase
MKKSLKMTPDPVLKQYMTPTVFQAFTTLSRQKQSINLGQGFPNWTIPDFLNDSIDQVLNENTSSENFSFGCTNLLSALSKEYSPIFKRELNPMENFIVCTGGAGVLSSLCASLSKDDEIILFEPFWSFYEPMLRFFRAKIKFVKLIQNEHGRFGIDYESLLSTITSNTKWIFLNSPQNPTGKIFNYSEFEFLAELTDKFPNLKFMSDEVYEHIVYNAPCLPRIANHPKLWDKTISVFSGGKTYSCTGWRIGWAIGPKVLIDTIKTVQHTTIGPPSSLIQEALAKTIVKGHQEYKNFDNFYLYLKSLFTRNVKILEDSLNESEFEFKVISPEGGYFMTADISHCISKMPVYYLFSEQSRKGKENLKSLYLKNIKEYQEYKGKFLFRKSNNDRC